MLRFFSRRKIKGGRAEQKAGVGARNRTPGRVSKHALPCNIMLLDGSDLALEIGVRRIFFAPFSSPPATHLSAYLPAPHMNIGHCWLLPPQTHSTLSHFLHPSSFSPLFGIFKP